MLGGRGMLNVALALTFRTNTGRIGTHCVRGAPARKAEHSERHHQSLMEVCVGCNCALHTKVRAAHTTLHDWTATTAKNNPSASMRGASAQQQGRHAPFASTEDPMGVGPEKW